MNTEQTFGFVAFLFYALIVWIYFLVKYWKSGKEKTMHLIAAIIGGIIWLITWIFMIIKALDNIGFLIGLFYMIAFLIFGLVKTYQNKIPKWYTFSGVTLIVVALVIVGVVGSFI
ncbi:hypothetical protein M0812_10748 [Anaeramoeba flamelloides]|uniref:Uncharacterized protein n=1 Tax=Anaeramoeba flamelloides TaxID=1746091 RepID=A0AAV7ZWK6_9EUKA|nr:hypothetical protein M0812_10748 [Anaeramoeba flamelloides]